jgi:hypothetical protein
MRRFAWALVWLGLFVAAPATAEEPTGFAEFPWGSKLYELVAPCTSPPRVDYTLPSRPFQIPAYPPRETRRDDGTLAISCWRSIEIGGEKWTPTLVFVGSSEGWTLARYEISCGYYCFKELRRIAVEKFGPPHQASISQYRMGNGAQIEGEVASWRWEDGTSALLVERDGKIDRAALTVSTRAFLELWEKYSRERIEKAKKAF